jgi:hypothetical protein
MKRPGRVFVNVVTAGLLLIGLAACLVSGPNYVVYEPEPKAGKTRGAGEDERRGRSSHAAS